MKAFYIRLTILIVLGILAIIFARPVMEQVMLYQENQKAKKITPGPDYIPPPNIVAGGVGGGQSEDVPAVGEQPSGDTSEGKADDSGKAESSDK